MITKKVYLFSDNPSGSLIKYIDLREELKNRNLEASLVYVGRRKDESSDISVDPCQDFSLRLLASRINEGAVCFNYVPSDGFMHVPHHAYLGFARHFSGKPDVSVMVHVNTDDCKRDDNIVRQFLEYGVCIVSDMEMKYLFQKENDPSKFFCLKERNASGLADAILDAELSMREGIENKVKNAYRLGQKPSSVAK